MVTRMRVRTLADHSSAAISVRPPLTVWLAMFRGHDGQSGRPVAIGQQRQPLHGRSEIPGVHWARPAYTLRMRLLRLVLLAAVACASPGCLVVSLDPIYTATTIQADETLLGSWENPDDRSSVVVERGEWKSYRVTYTSGSTSLDLVAYETKIGDQTFLDLTPARGLESGQLMIPAHLACRLTKTGNALTISGLNYDWFVVSAEHHVLGKLDTAFDSRKNLVVVSGTDTIRAWIRAHLASAEAFGEPVAFTRRK